MAYKNFLGLRSALQGNFSQALAVANVASPYGTGSWLPLDYYRAGMYATAAGFFPQVSLQDWRYVLPVGVSLAACGQHDVLRQHLAKVRWQAMPQRLRIEFSDALAPFMPNEALQVLQTVGQAAPPTLLAGLLLRVGEKQQALQLLEQALHSGQASHYPELYLYRSMAQEDSPLQQLERLNAFLQAHKVPGLALCNADLPPGPCNVQVAQDLPSLEGPLVSVLMTTFRTGERASVAIESLLKQTYRNLEIIVVDDASGDTTPDLVQAWAQKDARVRLLRLTTNGGTYLAKSMGLQLARGEFVTCHDSDDWSHPLKIERQVRPLLTDSALVATTSHWVRMQDDGMFYARPVHPLMRFNPSSPLFRREVVLERMGAWDMVRTGADSEFHARLKLVFGKRAVKRIAQPLALGSHREGSLMTAGDTGYSDAGISPQRLAYWEAWGAWHIACLRQGGLPRLPQDLVELAANRPFAAPEEICVSAQQVRAAQQEAIMKKIGIFSDGILRIPFLAVFLGVLPLGWQVWRKPAFEKVAGWGLRPSASKAQAYARKHQLPYLALEDGFVRSFGTGDHFPPLSLVMDDAGIYYDCTRPSALEHLLASAADVLQPDAETVRRARAQLLQAGLSKYNHAPDLPVGMLRPQDVQRVLVVDQTAGDMSVALGGADAQTFAAMLAAALSENPQATVYVKTHPEVTSGRKGGYLTAVQPDARVVVLRDAVNPLSLIQQMDKVYVVSSTMGFEALLAGKPVVCFGVPWYAGWGVTDDRQIEHPALVRRMVRQRSVDELFAAGYMQYTRYLNPQTHQQGTIFDVMAWLRYQRELGQRFEGRMVVVGFRRWKAKNVCAMLSLHPGKVVFVENAQAAAALQPQGADCLVCWGRVPPAGVAELAAQCGVRLLRMEDGFVRSVGLGSDLIPPQSFVLDAKGIYFDPSQPSELEEMLNTRAFTPQDMQRAQWVRDFIVRHGITKYNVEPLQAVQWPSAGRQVVLVPGQVEDDASIRFGCDTVQGVHTNLGLLQAARAQFPDAFIVYKPHPDVLSGNRVGRVALAAARQWADHVEVQASVVSCIEACDVVVTMTSLTGFDALLRGKQVVVHGRPFYAGWGLTQDVLPVPRRERSLTLDELVAGALLHYPLYWDPVLKGYTTCEAVLRQLLAQREALAASGQLQRLRVGWLRRQWRKLLVEIRARL